MSTHEEKYGTINIRTLAFDVFGTVVDWRSGVARAVIPFLSKYGRADLDPHRFADGWRARYQPAMAASRAGDRGFVRLDQLHRETLEDMLRRLDFDPAKVEEADLVDLAYAWRRLDAWPDVHAGMTRLARSYPLVTLSNANIALALSMARFVGLRWDAILGAEVSGAYKPEPRAYFATAEVLGLDPSQIALVAAHHSDLAAARACGLRTIYVSRPMEYGGRPAPDADARQDWDLEVEGFDGIADALGC